MTTRIIVTITMLLTLAQPLSSLAMGTTDDPKSELHALISAAEKEVAATPVWQKAETAQRQQLTEEAVRRKIITTVQGRFDKMQMQLDRKIDELVDKGFYNVLDPDVQKKVGHIFPVLFKEELYRYMYRKEETNIEQTYERGRDREGDLRLLITEGLKNNGAFERELENVIKNVNKRMGNVLDRQQISEICTCIFGVFNALL